MLVLQAQSGTAKLLEVLMTSLQLSFTNTVLAEAAAEDEGEEDEDEVEERVRLQISCEHIDCENAQSPKEGHER